MPVLFDKMVCLVGENPLDDVFDDGKPVKARGMLWRIYKSHWRP